MLALAAVVRFCHFALFEEPLLSLPSYVVDFAMAFAAAALGYRMVRAQQMAHAVRLALSPLGAARLAPARSSAHFHGIGCCRAMHDLLMQIDVTLPNFR